MSAPRVSVVIPCYNQEAFLAEAISSGLQQEYPELQVVVVNDGSTDGSAAVAAGFGPSITYVEQANSGVAAARNAGVGAASGDYVAFLDGDDVALPGRIGHQVDYLQHHPETGLVAGDALLYDGTRDLGKLSARAGKPKNLTDFRWETTDFCPIPSTCMVRRTCYDTVEGFDERFRRSGSEDWLFAVRLSAICGLAYLDYPLARYRQHAGSATNNEILMHAQNRLAAQAAVEWVRFGEYPAFVRARLLYIRFACSWRGEPKAQAIKYLLAAIQTDPRQLPYGWSRLRPALSAALRRPFS